MPYTHSYAYKFGEVAHFLQATTVKWLVMNYSDFGLSSNLTASRALFAYYEKSTTDHTARQVQHYILPATCNGAHKQGKKTILKIDDTKINFSASYSRPSILLQAAYFCCKFNTISKSSKFWQVVSRKPGQTCISQLRIRKIILIWWLCPFQLCTTIVQIVTEKMCNSNTY